MIVLFYDYKNEEHAVIGDVTIFGRIGENWVLTTTKKGKVYLPYETHKLIFAEEDYTKC